MPVLAALRHLNSLVYGRVGDGDPEQESSRYVPREQKCHRSAISLAIWFALAIGLLLRAGAYASKHGLFLDEAATAVGLTSRSALRTLDPPLEYGQVAAPGFLLAEKAALAILGTSELAIRFVPFLAGLAGLILLVPLVRRTLTGALVPAGLFLGSTAAPLVYYGSFAKPYTVDLLATEVVLLGAFRWLDGDGARVLLPAGIVAPWFSIPASLVLAGVAGSLLLFHLLDRPAGSLRLLGGIIAAWACSAIPALLVSRSYNRDPAYVAAFWRFGFPTADPGWWWRTGLQTLFNPLGLASIDFYPPRLPASPGLSWLVLVVAIAAVVGLVSRPSREALLLLSPCAVTLAASVVRLYPLGNPWPPGGRMIMFLAVPLLLLLLRGLEPLSPRLRMAGVGVLLLGSAQTALWGTAINAREELPPVLAYVRDHWQAGDLIYVYYGARPAFEYYAPRYGFAAADAVMGVCARLEPERYAADLDAYRPRSRLWVMFVRPAALFGLDDETYMTDYLERIGRRIDLVRAPRASAHLFALTGQPVAVPRYTVPPLSAADSLRYSCSGPFSRDEPGELETRGPRSPLSRDRK